MFLHCDEVFFLIFKDEMVKRITNRDQNRIDDNLNTLKNRFQVFNNETIPVV